MYELEGAIERLGSYGKDIMIMETGYPAQWAVGGTTYDYTRTFPYTEDGQKVYTDSFVNMLNKHSNVKGLFWWFPEANEFGLDWNTKRVTDQWYNATLFNNQNGRAFKAVGSLKNFLQTSTGIKAVGARAATSAGGAAWYTLSGRKMKSKPVEKGIYVNGKRKWQWSSGITYPQHTDANTALAFPFSIDNVEGGKANAVFIFAANSQLVVRYFLPVGKTEINSISIIHTSPIICRNRALCRLHADNLLLIEMQMSFIYILLVVCLFCQPAVELFPFFFYHACDFLAGES